jgi:uncharacterized protein
LTVSQKNFYYQNSVCGDVAQFGRARRSQCRGQGFDPPHLHHRHYHTTNETAIVGESLAGLFVVETFLLEPNLSDTYIAFDPSLWWNNQKLIDGAVEQLRSRPKLEKTLYFVSSGEDTSEITQRFANILGKNALSGISWHYEKIPDEKHSTIYHPAALKAFRTVFKPSASKQ